MTDVRKLWRMLAIAPLLAAACAAAAHDLKGIAAERRLRAAAGMTDPEAAMQAELAAKDAAIRDAQRQLQEMVRQAGTLSVLVEPRVWDPGAVLDVCFYQDGFASTKAEIAKVAAEWSQHGNITFDFGGPKFRLCSKGDKRLIRITLRGMGFFSLIGREAYGKDAPNVPTMSLEDIDRLDPRGAKFRWLVLHEFGHAIGLAHEHANPHQQCLEQYDREWIEARYNWSPEEALKNLETISVSNLVANGKFYTSGSAPDGSTITFSEFDRESVMNYHLSADAFRKPPGNCYLPAVNSRLSARDALAAAYAYPRKKAAVRQNERIEKFLAETPSLRGWDRRSVELLRRKVE